MASTIKTNLPNEPLRWNLIQAAYENGITDDTLRKYLIRAEEEPGADGCYSTAQIVNAIYGSRHRESLRKLREEADKLALENATTRGEVLYREPLAKGASDIVNALTQLVHSSSMTRQEQDDFLHTASRIQLVIENVTQRQRKIKKSKGEKV